ncbi:cysteine--tRNA ligase [Candidatus Pacearchaeota archaeon]|nr:cysteine--tRNA ligase [Candidatus Pacearchaeota archaeon]
MLKLFNTLGRKKEAFKPIRKGEIGIYTCGPTVYWYQHIGNLRSYIFSDILKRTLIYNGYKVKHVMNITDVGHLTSDADEGEDKIEKAAKREGKKAGDIANFYWNVFKEDFKKLNIIEPSMWCKATEHIKEQIELIKKLEKKGYTYKTSDGIYFDTSKLKDYGKLAKLKKEGLKAGARISLGEKRNATDFALWKFSEKPGIRQQEWNSPWSIGFPGWHIECSAMSMRYLGKHFDIHTGGEDHIPVHHTNEIAQSEAATGKKFVNYWLHGAFLTSKGEKVSKSKGGLYTISELERLEFKPFSYRYLCLTAHYRTQLEFSLEILKNAQNSYERLKNIIKELKDDGKVNESYLKRFEDAINDDLDMPKALAVLWELLRDEKAEGKIKTIEKMDRVFGLDLLKKEKIEIPAEVKRLVDERESARKSKDWKKADELREKIKQRGFYVDDTGEGAKIKRL